MSFANGNKGWIGVDLDGTLACYDHWRGPGHIGAPVPAMVDRVKKWLASGIEVRIVTARVTGGFSVIDDHGAAVVRRTIEDWLIENIGQSLPVTNAKDYAMIELWDDRAIQVIPNTGRTIADELASVQAALSGKAAGPNGERS